MEIKIKYYWEDYKNVDGNIISEIRTIPQIEDRNTSDSLQVAIDSNKILARCLGTGLKDKNGNEIFEGDIVKIIYEGIEQIGVIKCETKLYSGFAVQIEGNNHIFNYTSTPCFEIIGNSVQNPELLTKE